MSTQPRGAANQTSAERRSQGRLRRWWGRFHHRSPHETTPPMRVSEGEVGGVETRRGEGNRGSLGPKAAGCTLVAGAYVTDGCSLFRIEHTHADRGSGK